MTVGRVASAVVLGLLLPGWCPAEDGRAAEIAGIRVGVGGCYKAGVWTPVEVTLRGGSLAAAGQLIVQVPDGDGAPVRYATTADEPCTVDAGRESSVWTYVRIGRSRGAMEVEFVPREGAPVKRVFRAGEPSDGSVFPEAIGPKESLLVVVGPDAMGVDRAVDMLRVQAGQRARLARVADLGRLPTQWYGYEGVDAVVVSTSRPEVAGGLRPGAPQIAALEQWVRMGGTLVVSAGRRAGEVLAEGALLARFSPGKFQRIAPLHQASVLETYCNSKEPIAGRGIGGVGELRVAQLAGVEGLVESREATLPLVVRRAMGFGHVVFAAFDLDEPPLAGWPDRGLLAGKLLGIAPTGSEESRESAAALPYGYGDVAGQLRSALEQFPDVTVVPFWVVVSVMCAYLVLIGPGDYFFVRKVVRRMPFTWVTFSLVVVAFAAGAHLIAQRLKGDRIRVNQVDLVDVDGRSGLVRGTSWATVLSPTVEQYDFAFDAANPGTTGSPAPKVLVGWLGLPGEGFGGMAAPTTPFTPWRQPYDGSAALGAMQGVPIQVWATKNLTGRWTAATEVGATEAGIEARLADADQGLTGSLTSRLDFPLANCRLCYERWVYDLGDVPPGRSVSLSSAFPRVDLKTFLTGRRVLFEENRELSNPYDRTSLDLNYIIRAMTFFKAAGGSHYFGLVNRYQGFTDMSDLLGTGHAVLLGAVAAGPEPASRHGARLLGNNGQTLHSPGDRHTTFYRFLFPVKKTGKGARD